MNGEAALAGERRIDLPTWFAYIAGFLDGEGSFSASERNGVTVSASNTFPWVLHALQQEFGGYVRVSQVTNGMVRTAFQWRVHGQAALDCCSALAPYLFEKRPQALLVLEWPGWPPRSAKRQSIVKELGKLKRIDYV